jgi:hypothetical protein
MKPSVSLLVVALIAVSCTDPPATVAPSTAAVYYLPGVLEVQGTAIVTFNPTRTGPANVTLVSVTTDTRGPASDVVLDMGFGTPADGGCAITSSVQAAPRLSAHLVTSVTASTEYCVMLADIGNLKGPVNFAVRVVLP